MFVQDLPAHPGSVIHSPDESKKKPHRPRTLCAGVREPCGFVRRLTGQIGVPPCFDPSFEPISKARISGREILFARRAVSNPIRLVAIALCRTSATAKWPAKGNPPGGVVPKRMVSLPYAKLLRNRVIQHAKHQENKRLNGPKVLKTRPRPESEHRRKSCSKQRLAIRCPPSLRPCQTDLVYYGPQKISKSAIFFKILSLL
jgi:hypothetical protein